VKAISTGGIETPNLISPIVEKRTAPTRVLDLLIDRSIISGNEFEYIRQSVRTSNAGPVADNATKPTSVYTFEDESDRVRVFAHLTEPIPLRILADHKDVASVLQRQLGEDLLTALEEDVLLGDGTGEHFTGLTAVTGTLTQAYTGTVLATLRKALTQLAKTGESPTAWVLNYDDLEAIDLIREDGATGGFMSGIDEKIFGNLPKIGTNVIPPGTAYLGDWHQARLVVRENGRLDADVSGELFDKNQMKLRYEGRFGFAVLRPSAFVEVALTPEAP
jgi:HK97 family phage major capsid protein